MLEEAEGEGAAKWNWMYSQELNFTLMLILSLNNVSPPVNIAQKIASVSGHT